MDVILIILHDFYTFCTNFVPTKNLPAFFCSLNNIPKDGEFQGLSESRWIGLGWHDLTRLEAKYWFLSIDPPSLVKDWSLTKTHLYNYSHKRFCRKLFSASFETRPNFRQWTETEKISKYCQNAKKVIFAKISKNGILGSSAFFTGTSEKANILDL